MPPNPAAARSDDGDRASTQHEGADVPNPTDPQTTLTETLTRIEVKVSETAKDVVNVKELLVDIKAEVIQHRGQIGTIESHVQQLQSDAKASAKAVIDAEDARVAVALLLKETTKKALDDAKAADDKKVLDAKTLVEQSTTTWSKRQILAGIGTFIVAIIVGVFGIVWAIKTGPPPPVIKP